MVLLGAALAFRGDSIQPILWSDLGMDNVLNTGTGFDATIMV